MDKFEQLLKKWEQESRDEIEIANREKLDFLNKVDSTDTIRLLQ